jgi:hypothetical protein
MQERKQTYVYLSKAIISNVMSKLSHGQMTYGWTDELAFLEMSQNASPGNSKGGSITVLLTSCLTGLDWVRVKQHIHFP